MSDHITADFTVKFFSGIVESDDNARAEQTAKIVDTVELWAATQGHNRVHRELLNTHLPNVLQLSVQSPFANVRNAFKALLQRLQAQNISVPQRRFTAPSAYIKSGYLKVETTVQEEHELLKDLFLFTGRLSHVMQLLTAFPDFVSALADSLNVSMAHDGPIPVTWRAYVAVMAASRFECSYLIHLHRLYFIVRGGDPKWLKGIEYAPSRLQNLQELNCLLAHRAWAITPDHIRKLLRGPDSWSMSELAQIVVIMASHHALACCALAMGATPEIDSPEGHYFAVNGQPTDRADTGGQSTLTSDDVRWTLKTVETLKTMGGVETTPTQRAGEGACNSVSHFQGFAGAETETDTIAAAEHRGSHTAHSLSSLYTKPPAAQVATGGDGNRQADIGRWPLEHKDFDTRSDRICRVQDYSWQTHTYSQLNSLYGIADLLDKEFRMASEMTDNTLGCSEVDTTKFRRAIWFYVHRVCGISHDDYDYSEVNQLLERLLKVFVKKSVVCPQLLTEGDVKRGCAGLRDEEKVHICILSMEARKQACLVHFFLSVMHYNAS